MYPAHRWRWRKRHPPLTSLVVELLVGREGIEPSRLAALALKASASAFRHRPERIQLLAEESGVEPLSLMRASVFETVGLASYAQLFRANQ